MTDLPDTPPAASPQSSVVIDTNAIVKKSRLPLIISVLVVLGLAAFTIVYFATHEGTQPYKPGPEATAVVQGLAAAGIDGVEFSDDELRCFDATFAGYDVSLIEGGYDPLAGDLDEDGLARSGTLLDDCLQPAHRLTVIAGNIASSGLATAEQAQCVAKGFDGVVMDAGGYTAAFAPDSTDLTDELIAVFSDCGVDVGGTPTEEPPTDGSPCAAELKTLQTAVEAYYATNGADPAGYDDLVPGFLREDPSVRFEFIASTDGGIPSFHGVGECDGYDG